MAYHGNWDAQNEKKLSPDELLTHTQDHVKSYMTYRDLRSSSWCVINHQKKLKDNKKIPKSDFYYRNQKNDYFVFNKNNALHPISIREENDNFGPIRRFNQLNLLSDKVWLCGGAIRSCLDGEKPNDFDIFCQNHTEYLNLIKKFSSTLLKEHFRMTYMCRSQKTVERIHKEDEYKDISTHVNELCGIPSGQRTLLINVADSDDDSTPPVIKEQKEPAGVEVTSFKSTSVLYKDMKIQVIYIPGYHSIIDCMDDFDFYVCRFGFDGDSFYMHDGAGVSFQRKTLDMDVDSITYPVSALRRISKYGKYGYSMTADIAERFFKKINKTRYKKHQLVGYVD